MNEPQTKSEESLTLRELATRRVVRLQDLAAEAGMTPARFSNVISGAYAPVGDEISRMAKAFGVSVKTCERAAQSTRHATA